RDMEAAIAQSRIRNWKGVAPSVTADLAVLAAPLHLDSGTAEHRALLDGLLAAPDGKSRDAAFRRMFEQTGLDTRNARQAAIKGFDDAIAGMLGDLARKAVLPLDDGRSLVIEWEPQTASVLA